MKRFYLLLFALFLINVANAQWTALNSGTTQNLHAVYFPDANTGYAVGASGTILKTGDGGAHWITLNSGTTVTLNSVFCVDDNTVYVVGQAGTIILTIDGGNIWTDLSVGGTNAFNSIIYLSFSPGIGYIVGQNGTMYYFSHSGSGGTDPTLDPTGTTNSLNSVCFSAAGYAVGGSGTILKSTDLFTWTALLSGTPYDLYSVYFPTADTGYAVGGNAAFGTIKQHQIILKTTDGGTFWYPLSSGTTIPLYSVYFTTANTGYAVGGTNSGINQSQIIYKTIDGGATWTSLSSGTNNSLLSVYFMGVNTGFAVGYGGTILKTTNGGASTAIKENILPKSTYTLSPNPSSGKVIIINNNPSKESTVSIFNMTGQQMMSQKFNKQEEMELNISQFLKGIYIVKIQVDNEIVNKQLVIR